mmetsp:Transcript_37076/g.83743  ORF Transcript_37076/g.83743 Transcript_37076/m.83743 type:complete len:204 (+) Transcript_37076:71-682(+)
MLAAEQERCTGIYVCDLTSGLADTDLYGLFSQWGRMMSFERINQGADEALAIEYESWEGAKEARTAVNYSCVRDKTVRCLFRSDIKAIRQSMLRGNRLMIENLDLTLDSHGLYDACSLFGNVLDCKIEHKKEQSCGYGFVHFAALEDAEKAQGKLNGMQLGDSTITVQCFEWKDTQRFTGCHYSTHINRELSADTAGYVIPTM